nr:sigma-70 family RNA polymerase sigma factor [Bacteroidota bacterium]
MQLTPFRRKKENLSDKELIERYLEKQDTEFLGELFGRYMHLVYGVCLKYFKEPERSKDTVILIYEKVQHEIVNHEIDNFKNWLYVVTKNFCLMELRKSNTTRITLVPDENQLAEIMEKESELHPIDNDNGGVPEDELNDCIEKLKDEQKQCIRLFYFENKCYREISDMLRVEEKRVKSHIQNGKRNLKICMENQK